MLFLKAAELEKQGIDCDRASQIVFYRTQFTRGQSFHKLARQAAISICKQYLRADIVCLIVESQDRLTLWRENKNSQLATDDLIRNTDRSIKYLNPKPRDPAFVGTSNFNPNIFKRKNSAA